MTSLILILSIAFAQNCSDQAEDLGPYSFRRTQYSKALGCVVHVKAKSSAVMPPTRYFNFFKDGQIQVRTQIGSITDTNSTGYRNYFVLPANDTPEIKKLGGLGVRVKDSAGLDWAFNEQGDLKNENGCKVKANPKITWEAEATDKNKEGGFFLSHCPGSVIVDIGFKRTRDAVLEKDRVIAVRDSKGKSCSLKNSDIFTYPNKSEGIFKYKNPKDFHRFLSTKDGCKDLDLSPLNTKSGSSSSGVQR